LAQAEPVDQTVEVAIRSFVQDDLAALRPELEARAGRALQAAAEQLARNGASEADAMRTLLESTIKSIQNSDTIQLVLNLEDEKRQAELDRKSREAKLVRLQQDLATEPTRVEQSYRVAASRLEPVGLVYLWPSQA
ncbi:MAG: hypothetical protein MUF14_09310, partial [Hyphomonadaceae bacterium]|nr:hypothetical protein [Hyphomonadaceae bacterium]